MKQKLANEDDAELNLAKDLHKIVNRVNRI